MLKDEISDGDGFGLREWNSTGEYALTWMSTTTAGGSTVALALPIEVEVSIAINADAVTTVAMRYATASLPPHSIRGVRELITVWVDDRQYEPVVFRQQ
jgi:hypothetical protein